MWDTCLTPFQLFIAFLFAPSSLSFSLCPTFCAINIWSVCYYGFRLFLTFIIIVLTLSHSLCSCFSLLHYFIFLCVVYYYWSLVSVPPRYLTLRASFSLSLSYSSRHIHPHCCSRPIHSLFYCALRSLNCVIFSLIIQRFASFISSVLIVFLYSVASFITTSLIHLLSFSFIRCILLLTSICIIYSFFCRVCHFI